MPKVNEDSYWRAVLSRDVSYDGTFVFAVRSTGVYCLPSCPARRPRREQVVFFDLGESAERAGFRPCRRCRPAENGRNPQSELAERVCRYIEDNLEGPLTLKALSAQLGMSAHHLQRTFKRILGITPRQYADACRLGSFKAQVKEGKAVTGALYEAGYGSSRGLYERAARQLGMTPATYRRGGRGMRIGYTIVDCPLGRLLVAATERGVCGVSLGDSDAALKASLTREYPNAQIQQEQNGLSQWARELLNHLGGRQSQLNLPLDINATAFERRVWQELRAIPCGETRSYEEIARAVGLPRGARAVARACAVNPVALVIPCHRVVRKDGSLGGYRLGIERKRALLAQERSG